MNGLNLQIMLLLFNWEFYGNLQGFCTNKYNVKQVVMPFVQKFLNIYIYRLFVMLLNFAIQLLEPERV